MTNGWRMDHRFIRSAMLTAMTLAVLAALAGGAGALCKARASRPLAVTVQLMRSRAVIFNPGVAGYYERLFGTTRDPMFMSPKEYERWASGFRDRTYDRTFRIYRFTPNLNRLADTAEPQGLTTNSFGFLGPERALRKPPNTRRVAVLGDSLTQGWGVDQSRSYIALLENRLNAPDAAGTLQRFEVLNFSVPGYSLTQMLDVAAEDAPRFDPDLYILALSEISVSRNWDNHLVRVVQLGIDPKYDFLRDIVRGAGAAPGENGYAVLATLAPFRVPVIRGTIARIKALADARRVPLLVVLVPSLEDGAMNSRRFSGIPELLAKLDVPVISLLDTFDGNLDLEPLRINPFDVHPNARAHAMISDNLYARLRAYPEIWAALASAPFPESPHGNRTR